MGLLEQCEAAFGSADLYCVLGVRRHASADEICRGYRKASLRVHPDRVAAERRDEATRHFQVLGRAYAVLSDPEQRAVYDEQGLVDEESDVRSQDRDWAEYWRLLFKKITIKDIQDFEKKYKGSEEELADIKSAYKDFKGDMDKLMESVLCVDYTDEPRIRKIIQQAIDSGEVPSYKAFIKEAKQKMNARKRRAEEEAKEAEKSREELGLGEGEDDLKALIQTRNQNRKKDMDNFLAQLEAKYGNKSKKGGKKTVLKKGKK
ncbi:dnaJ homolog subfamily C member 9 [Alligator mississippiensis]|uniref:DnaJ homolog subfamily C member 9 n=1 Tax=Alligator mississippiensis TaxID=8496 RepID=A9CPE5_ALLMI|nr:dnaJ homolog subfamily C member 9 [Alligator mississippiensis]KYO42396.1 dnaJ-like protein subfamily C member 9 [Alligator mississippiensis]BAF94138.1 DnaJ [Alligator mississippiensis]